MAPKQRMSLRDFHGGVIPSELPLPSAPGVPPEAPRVYGPTASYLGPSERGRYGASQLPHRSLRGVETGDRSYAPNSANIGRFYEEDERKPVAPASQHAPDLWSPEETSSRLAGVERNQHPVQTSGHRFAPPPRVSKEHEIDSGKPAVHALSGSAQPITVHSRLVDPIPAQPSPRPHSSPDPSATSSPSLSRSGGPEVAETQDSAASAPSSPPVRVQSEDERLKERPRLKLLPRSKPLDDDDKSPHASETQAPPSLKDHGVLTEPSLASDGSLDELSRSPAESGDWDGVKERRKLNLLPRQNGMTPAFPAPQPSRDMLFGRARPREENLKTQVVDERESPHVVSGGSACGWAGASNLDSGERAAAPRVAPEGQPWHDRSESRRDTPKDREEAQHWQVAPSDLVYDPEDGFKRQESARWARNEGHDRPGSGDGNHHEGHLHGQGSWGDGSNRQIQGVSFGGGRKGLHEGEASFGRDQKGLHEGEASFRGGQKGLREGEASFGHIRPVGYRQNGWAGSPPLERELSGGHAWDGPDIDRKGRWRPAMRVSEPVSHVVINSALVSPPTQVAAAQPLPTALQLAEMFSRSSSLSRGDGRDRGTTASRGVGASLGHSYSSRSAHASVDGFLADDRGQPGLQQAVRHAPQSWGLRNGGLRSPNQRVPLNDPGWAGQTQPLYARREAKW